MHRDCLDATQIVRHAPNACGVDGRTTTNAAAAEGARRTLRVLRTGGPNWAAVTCFAMELSIRCFTCVVPRSVSVCGTSRFGDRAYHKSCS